MSNFQPGERVITPEGYFGQVQTTYAGKVFVKIICHYEESELRYCTPDNSFMEKEKKDD